MEGKSKIIGVLGGGISGEREISLLSARAAYNALSQGSFQAVFMDIDTSDENIIRERIYSSGIDLAFIALHGQFGEDGQIQKIMENMEMVYTGSDSGASASAMNKAFSKEIFLKNNIPTPRYSVFANKVIALENISWPVVVKPSCSGSSLGVSIARGQPEFSRAIDKAFSYDKFAIVEDYIGGREITVGILDEQPMGVVEIISDRQYYDFEAKYCEAKTKFIAPARLDSGTYKKIQEIGLAAHKALGCRHFSRVDIRLSKDNIPYVLEVNSIPGLTSHSLLPLSAGICGISFNLLIEKMTKLALYGKKETQKV
ncbi:MAG: D-alanine--D-alanine ligase [Candidatus Omnitrophica bacterium]|nr:D-alanine--D-alanine ligase [Candidatus Omnitrophota bacterium]